MPTKLEHPRFAAAGSTLAGLLIVSVVIFGLNTSEGRFAATTDNRSNVWTAAAITLQASATGVNGGTGPAGAGGRATTFLDAANMYPGVVLENCFDVVVATSLKDVQLRAFATRVEGTGLERYLDVQVWSGAKTTAGCDTFEPDQELFAGTLRQLGDRHGSFADGLKLTTNSADQVQLRVRARLQDDNAAQGLATKYELVLEARP